MNRGQKSIFLIVLTIFSLCVFFKTQLVEYNPTLKLTITDNNQKQILTRFELDQLKSHIYEPNKKEYNLSGIEKSFKPGYDYKVEHSVPDIVLDLLKGKKGGFFIEAGANDGEFLSNTLKMEMEHGWTGILIESDPVPFKILVGKNRKAYTADVCISTTNLPQTVKMFRPKHIAMTGFMAPISKELDEYEEFEAQCYPIGDILGVINISQVDYFSLDVEGAEMGILENFPWEEIQIKVMSIEVNKLNQEDLANLMESKGFKLIRHLEAYFMDDFIYAHKSLLN